MTFIQAVELALYHAGVRQEELDEVRQIITAKVGPAILQRKVTIAEASHIILATLADWDRTGYWSKEEVDENLQCLDAELNKLFESN